MMDQGLDSYKTNHKSHDGHFNRLQFHATTAISVIEKNDRYR